MRPRLLSPLLMSEFNKMISLRNNSSTTVERVEPRRLMRIKRDLFGPVNREDGGAFCERELRAISEKQCAKWNFDFVNEKPLDVPNPRYIWEKITPEESVPESYSLRRLPYLSKNTVLLQETERIKCHNNNNNIVLEEFKVSGRLSPMSEEVIKSSKQTHITDYMKTRKRRISATSTKMDHDEESPRTKVIKLT